MRVDARLWRCTFPDSEPGTDGVALFEGRIIGRVRLMAKLPRDPKPVVGPSPTRSSQAGRAALREIEANLPAASQTSAATGSPKSASRTMSLGGERRVSGR